MWPPTFVVAVAAVAAASTAQKCRHHTHKAKQMAQMEYKLATVSHRRQQEHNNETQLLNPLVSSQTICNY